MINVRRTQEVPNALLDINIQSYLDDLDLYKIDQQLPKESRSLSKPICKTAWRTSDLFDKFDEIFYSKCYLTEQKFETSWAMDVEHFVPRNEKPELTYVWENLYPAEHTANMLKPRFTPEYGYLDPCNPNDDVEKEVLYYIDFGGQKMHFGARNKQNKKAVNTATLLNHLHNGSSHETYNRTKELRFAIYKRYVEVLEWVNRWREAKMNNESEAEFRAEAVLKNFLSRKSSFTMLMRSISAVRSLPPDFFD